MIKPVLKNLKITHHGKKIYEKLINNYGDYFQNCPNKNSSKNVSFTKK